MKSRVRGFTLIELLVVIAIIAILAAILFPVFAKAREKARTITCTSNMKSLALAMNMYSQDYDETYPFSAALMTNSLGGVVQVYWVSMLEPYVKKGNASTTGGFFGDSAGGTNAGLGSVFVCPNYNLPAPAADEAGTSWAGQPVGRWPLASYSPNIEITKAWWSGSAVPPGTMGSILEPGQIVMLAENHDCCVETSGAPGVSNWTRAARRHNDGTNIALVDGHVKWFPGPRPQYGNTGGQSPGTPICRDKRNTAKPNCAVYFRPRGG